MSHVPGTEGEANESNKPFLDKWNATKADKEEAKPDTNVNLNKVLHDGELAVFRLTLLYPLPLSDLWNERAETHIRIRLASLCHLIRAMIH